MRHSGAAPVVLDGRYVLHGALGTGSMGVVYRATDRLSGETVAVKRVLAELGGAQAPARARPGSTSTLPASGSVEIEARRLGLANEFQTLASLRHPNIIAVLDYGFAPDPWQGDALSQPYFTMEFLAAARTILEAGRGRPVDDQVGLLVQLLQALAYLHRRGILHRDLKPGNVLVVDGALRVLDFGLSATYDRWRTRDGREAGSTAGTLAYMAPEVLRGEAAGEAADLYAAGVLAHELLAGRHPFDASNVNRLLDDVLHAARDPGALAERGVPDGVAQVVGRLLAREPGGRYASAEACIAALCRAVGQPPPPESAAIREGYLQAARFVGRDAELGRLLGTLERARAGHGAIWLVGGESGVGKSRLLDEVRIRALVKGVQVLRGQAVREGGVTYHVWRQPLRRLLLTVEVSDLEAGTLKALVTDVEALIGRPVPGVPGLDGQGGRQRLLDAITGVFGRLAAPTLLILEDLHWVDESLDVLGQLERLVGGVPLLVLASYRDDEAPGLPATVGCDQVMTLDRLPREQIAELSASMLGEAGRQPAIVHLLQQETEGNAFFLVEVVRALAEEAGRLSDVAHMALPARVFPQGMQTIVRRRLARVPADARPLLQLAAVAGRQIDPAVLGLLRAGVDLDAWLAACANAAVVAMRDEGWCFAHDKLRDGLLSALPGEELAGLHRRVAVAIEQVYGEAEGQAAALAHHWAEAGDADRERHYAALAGRHAQTRFAYEDAVRYLSRALALTPDSDLAGRFDLLARRERMLDMRGEREAQRRDLDAMESLAADPAGAGDAWRSHVALRLANYAWVRGDFVTAAARATEAAELAAQCGDVRGQALGGFWAGRALWNQGDMSGARAMLADVLSLARQAGLRAVEADSLRNLGNVSNYLGDQAEARDYLEQALAIHHEIGDRNGVASTLNSLGYMLSLAGDPAGARTYLEPALEMTRETGRRYIEGIILQNLGHTYRAEHDDVPAWRCYEQGLAIRREIGDRDGEGECLECLGQVATERGDYQAAAGYLEQALQLYGETGSPWGHGWALMSFGRLRLQEGRPDEAAEWFEQARHIHQDLGQRQIEIEALANLGYVARARGDYGQALARFERALALGRQEKGPRFQIPALIGTGVVQADLGRYAAAWAALDEAVSLATDAGDRDLEASALCALGSVLARLGDGEQARQVAERALAVVRETHDRGAEAGILAVLGDALAALDRAEAGPVYERALALARELNRNGVACMALAGLADLSLRRRELGRALDRVEALLPWLDGDRFALAYDPFRVRWVCHRVLMAWHDRRAGQVLADAQAALRARAALIEDEALRHSFLEGVRVHAEVGSAGGPEYPRA